MKRFAGVYLAAALMVGMQGCNTDSLPPASGFSSVAGVIVDGRTNAPIAGATVTIDTVLTATTDSAGKFSIDKVPSGITDYSVQAKGYQPLASTANVEPGKPFQLNLTLAQQPPH
ncbi:MAG: carboxypeptidase regulatory-like domain-containing protein [Candidatus Eremiobacteraeota bacterium]|nr:carboxypeptidase regulatory-like domain-containing protein [Candidatus Eremiobacteraeota bacterium]